jgi:starch-binding outer membrane protein, SusD/RagB family
MKTILRSRNALVAAALAAIAVGSACTDVRDDLLEPEQPSVIGPDQVNSPLAADALRKGALSRLRQATVGGESIWLLAGLMTDEWKSGDTFSQRNETDQRIVQTNNGNVSAMYVSEHRARGGARDALIALQTFIPDTVSKQAQMYWVMGVAELGLAENFCNGVPYGITVDGVPNYTDPLTSAEGFALALAHLDSGLALTTATDTFTVAVRNAIQVARARTLVNMGQFTQAAAAAATVATNFQYLQTFSLTTTDNAIWSLNTSQKRWVVGDSFDTGGLIVNAIPFASSGDPRVPKTGTTVNSPLNRAFDNSTWFVSQSMFARSDPVPLATGLDARLVEAEARLQANDIAGMMTILNALRTTSQKIGNFTVPVMAALPTPANQTAAVDLYFREKAFWSFSRGQRLSDLRRLIRQYGRTQDQVFPSGQFFKGGTYGTDVNFPVTTDEKPNPKWNGCIDRNA